MLMYLIVWTPFSIPQEWYKSLEIQDQSIIFIIWITFRSFALQTEVRHDQSQWSQQINKINFSDTRLYRLFFFFKMLSTWSAYKCFQVSKTAQFTTCGENEKKGERKSYSFVHTIFLKNKTALSFQLNFS